MFFEFGRKEGFPTQYFPHQTPVTVDILEVGVIAAFIILYICFLLATPSRSARLSWSAVIRITISLLIGLLIILGNIGQEWEVGHVKSRMPYRAGTEQEIKAVVGLKIGLRSINVTLKSTQSEQGKLRNETINYNERFSWEWDQGRFGFGPYAGSIQRQFREGQRIGLPIPILWIVDYFIIDGEGFRFGRFYRTAGWYAHIALWTAFPCWIVSNVLFRSVISYGAFFLALTGGLLLLSNILWSVIRNPLSLNIPFEDGIIITAFGINFWLTLVTGIVCIIIAVAIIVLNYTHDKELYLFFHVDNLNDYFESYTNEEQSDPDVEFRNQEQSEFIQMVPMPSELEDPDYNAIIANTKPQYMRRSLYKPKPKRQIVQDPLYENLVRNSHTQF